MRHIHFNRYTPKREKFATVDGPLFSLEARGKIGDAIVFFPWKGRHAVRRWLKPTNPRDIDQKLVRQKLAAFGKVLGAIVTPCTATPNGAAAVVEIKTLTPATQIWNAYLVKKGLADLSVDSAWTDLMTEVAQTSTITEWTNSAEALGLTTLLSTADGFASDVPPQDQLAAAAYACWKMDYSDAVIDMSVHPSSMKQEDILAFASQLTNA